MCRGCSSGKLQGHGVHDPSGPVLTYLQRGAPWVLGNLWDVTDKDIDRLSAHCMGMLFDDEHQSKNKSELFHDESMGCVPTALSVSRDICKLKYVVGCAPVLYGLPLKILDSV